MIEKRIKNIRDLENFKWEYKEKSFYIYPYDKSVVELKQKNTVYEDGETGNIFLRDISIKNLSELEFYGLKVILELAVME